MPGNTVPGNTVPSRTTVPSPVGDITLVADGGALTQLWMGPMPERPPPDAGPDVHAGPDGSAEPDGSARPASAVSPEDAAVLTAAAAQLTEYFAGERTSFDLPLAARGTPFQQAVWAALREIPYGETTSYGEIAARVGQPTAARAVGLANGRNPIGIIVPCHRVIGAGGRLVGYGGGLDRKRFLLGLEGRVSGRTLV